jgi:hypothetical protein
MENRSGQADVGYDMWGCPDKVMLRRGAIVYSYVESYVRMENDLQDSLKRHSDRFWSSKEVYQVDLVSMA